MKCASFFNLASDNFVSRHSLRVKQVSLSHFFQ
jgi:hypothetical protein